MIHLIAAMFFISLTHLTCYAAMSERKYSVKKTGLIYTLYCLTFVCLAAVPYLISGSNLTAATSVAYLCAITVSFFLFILTSADPLCKKVFLFVSYSNVYCIFQCVVLIVCAVYFPDLPQTAALYGRNIARTLLYVPAVWIYIRFLRPTIREISGKKKKTWYSISLVSVLFLAVFSILLTLCQTPQSQGKQYILLFCIAVLIYCSVLWVLFGTIKNMSNENKMELIEKNMEYLQGQLQIAKENDSRTKTIRHDFRHHNQNIAAMLKKGDTEKALRYIEQYNESLDAAKPVEFCPHATVNAILNSFYVKTQREGISVSVAADTGEDTSIADMDFVAILSNLLENAVNGCRECGSHGRIKVNIRTVADKTVIVCSNPCQPNLPIKDNMISCRGIGIDSMISAAKRYDGDISYCLEDGILTACLILKSGGRAAETN